MNTIALKRKTGKTKINGSEIVYQSFLFVMAVIVLFLIISVKAKTATDFWSDPFLLIYTIFVTTFQLSRVVGAMLYTYSSSKIIQNQNDEFYEPTVTFVIPCKNEEKSIAKTISKSFDADYPENKIEVIVINDGSTDGTINVLNQLKNDYKNLTVVDWKVNRGKRHGMAEGFRLAKGEIIVQLDSDSYIDPSTFRNLVRPFQNPEIGAVCAHADPENADENLLTKMQAAYYFVSFRILKAAESTFLTVFCCSGCSSAYRKSIILPILDVWLNEKFLGLPITWGDDRALTNRVLKMNYQTIYTDKVQAYTICPNNIRTFLKQQVRWKKGWFVNSLFVSRFIYKRHPFVALTYFFPLIFVTLATPFMATKALIYNPIFAHTSPLFYIIGVFLVACIMVIYYRSVSRENKYWPYVFVWSAINMVVLSFILFYALATIQNRKWGTR
ncbi:MAG: glycosyltransferase [Candidatus Paceibacterota bacterium]